MFLPHPLILLLLCSSGESYVVSGLKTGSAVCKASTLSTALSHWLLILHFIHIAMKRFHRLSFETVIVLIFLPKELHFSCKPSLDF